MGLHRIIVEGLSLASAIVTGDTWIGYQIRLLHFWNYHCQSRKQRGFWKPSYSQLQQVILLNDSLLARLVCTGQPWGSREDTYSFLVWPNKNNRRGHLLSQLPLLNPGHHLLYMENWGSETENIFLKVLLFRKEQWIPSQSLRIPKPIALHSSLSQGRSLSEPHLSEAENTALLGTETDVTACEAVCEQKRGGSQQWPS